MRNHLGQLDTVRMGITRLENIWRHRMYDSVLVVEWNCANATSPMTVRMESDHDPPVTGQRQVGQ